MGNKNSGARPKPTALKVLQGNPGKRALPEHEPYFEVADEAFDLPPDEIADNPVSAGEWRRVAPLLRRARVVTEVDRHALLTLCQHWAAYCDAQRKIRTLGMVVKGPRDVPMVNPYLKVSDKAFVHCLRLWQELGLTPSSRARISALPVVTGARGKWEKLLA